MQPPPTWPCGSGAHATPAAADIASLNAAKSMS